MNTVPIRRYPTKLHLFCPCGRQAFVTVFLKDVPRLKCSKCGGRPNIASRDRTAAWARQRRGK